MPIGKRNVAELRRLREMGFSVREISKRTGVPSATVHRYVRQIQVNGHHPETLTRVLTQRRGTRDHGFTKKPGRYIEIERGRRYHGLLIHLPDPVFCPYCGLESADLVFCLDCGNCWIGDCGHGGEVGDEGHRGINLAELRRGKGEGDLHVLPLTFQG